MGIRARRVGTVTTQRPVYKVEKTIPWGWIIFWGFIGLVILGNLAGE